MTAHRDAGRPLTSREMRAVVYRIAWTYLEVERGLRPYQQLEAFLTPGAYRRHLVTNSHLGVAGHGPVRPHDIARIHLAHTTPDRVDADVLVRRGEDGWSTLVVDLTHRGHGWQVARLDRLEHLVVREPPDITPPPDLTGQIARRNDELKALTTARDAIADRIDAIGDGRLRAARELRSEWERWDDRCRNVAYEVAGLRRQHAAQHANPEAALEPTTTDEQDRWLGPRPHDGGHAVAWDRAYEVVAAYRERWGLDEGDNLLGGCENETQRRDLRQVLTQICEYEAECRPRTPHLEQGLEFELGDMAIT